MASKVNKEQDPPEIDENICWGKNYPKLYNEIMRNVKKIRDYLQITVNREK
jgi:hypothetical protein